MKCTRQDMPLKTWKYIFFNHILYTTVRFVFGTVYALSVERDKAGDDLNVSFCFYRQIS